MSFLLAAFSSTIATPPPAPSTACPTLSPRPAGTTSRSAPRSCRPPGSTGEWAERKDVVESVKLTLRNHPIAGWLFILFLALGALLAFVNQLLEFLKNVGMTR